MKKHYPIITTVIPPGTSPEQARAILESVMDDCPLCEEARARGEVPQIMNPRYSRVAERFRRPRWRDLRRRVQRR